jgi:hypothetical protein
VTRAATDLNQWRFDLSGFSFLGGASLIVCAYLVLALTEAVSVCLGLLISAVVGNSRQLANFLLPLVMIAQMVFSVRIAGQADKMNAGVEPAYQSLADNPVADVMSRFTMSRYADILLRTFLYDPAQAGVPGSWEWLLKAIVAMLFMSTVFVSATLAILRWQTGRAPFALWRQQSTRLPMGWLTRLRRHGNSHDVLDPGNPSQTTNPLLR